jgi:hypothetical protein
MAWFRKLWRTRADQPDPGGQEARELLDQYHQRASLRAGDRMVIVPSKVLENIALAMERVDLDINTEICIEEDVVSTDELMNMVDELAMGPTVAAHVVNNALRITVSGAPASPTPTTSGPRSSAPVADYRRCLTLSGHCSPTATSAISLHDRVQ